MPGPMPQMSVIGRWNQISRLNDSSSSCPMPSLACFAQMSSATFAWSMFGPMPAVAVTLETSKARRIRRFANVRASVR